MKKRYLFICLCYLVSINVLADDFGREQKEKEGYTIQLTALKSKKTDFVPSIKPLVGVIFKTFLQGAEPIVPNKTGYNFQPGALKLGLAGFTVYLTPTLSTVATYGIHGNGKLTDAFVRYQPTPSFGIRLGRMRGTGVRASFETGPFNVDLAEYPYIAESLAAAQGTSDLRHFGIELTGRYKWLKGGFFLHNNDFLWTGVNSSLSDGLPANRGLSFKSWDASLSLTPIKLLEFGGHLASVNLPGMGKAAKSFYSAFFYLVEPDRYKLKFDYGHYSRIDIIGKDGGGWEVEVVAPDYNDYSPKTYRTTKRSGFSILGGYFINKQFELVARFEAVDHARIDDEHLKLYTVGINYYIPNLSKHNKITLFMQHRQEKQKTLRNDLLCIQYQFYL